MAITQVPPLVLAKGILTFVPGLLAFSNRFRRVENGTVSARYCYSVWLRHLVMAHDRGLPTNPQVLVEFGPGSSIGTGLAALIAGAAPDRFRGGVRMPAATIVDHRREAPCVQLSRREIDAGGPGYQRTLRPGRQALPSMRLRNRASEGTNQIRVEIRACGFGLSPRDCAVATLAGSSSFIFR